MSICHSPFEKQFEQLKIEMKVSKSAHQFQQIACTTVIDIRDGILIASLAAPVSRTVIAVDDQPHTDPRLLWRHHRRRHWCRRGRRSRRGRWRDFIRHRCRLEGSDRRRCCWLRLLRSYLKITKVHVNWKPNLEFSSYRHVEKTIAKVTWHRLSGQSVITQPSLNLFSLVCWNDNVRIVLVVPVGLSLGRGEGLLLLRREDDGGLLKLPGDDPFGAMFSSGRIHTCQSFASII